MRRLALVAVLGAVLAGCGGEETVAPTGEVEGTLPQAQPVQGNPARGKTLFAEEGCDGCHTFKAAGSEATTGPNLDESLQGDDEDYIRESIVEPEAEVVEGFQPIMPAYAQLPDKDVADLVAFLTQNRA